MELNPREAAFLFDEMSELESDETRHSSARAEARRIRKRAESELTE